MPTARETRGRRRRGELVFAHYCDGGWAWEVYYTPEASRYHRWQLHCEIEGIRYRGCTPERMELLLAAYVLNCLSNDVESVARPLAYWTDSVRKMVKDWDALATLPGAHPGFLNLLHAIKPKT